VGAPPAAVIRRLLPQVRFELAHAAKHVSEIEHFEEAHAPAQ
jgi:hypothetical protein